MRPNIAFALAALATASLAGCDSSGGDSGAFTLVYAPGNHTFSGDGARCRINTSYPDGDPLKGKFFASVTADDSVDYGSLSLTIHWVELTAPPAPGTYTEDQIAFSASVQLPSGTSVPASDGSGSVTVAQRSDGIRITIPDGYQVHGTIDCVPQ